MADSKAIQLKAAQKRLIKLERKAYAENNNKNFFTLWKYIKENKDDFWRAVKEEDNYKLELILN